MPLGHFLLLRDALPDDLRFNFCSSNIRLPTLPSIKTHLSDSLLKIVPRGHFLLLRDDLRFNFCSSNIRFPTLPSIKTHFSVSLFRILPGGHFIILQYLWKIENLYDCTNHEFFFCKSKNDL